MPTKIAAGSGSTARARRTYSKTPARRAQIIEAATKVFAANGYQGGSLRQIAGQLEVGLTSLVHHFPNKIELLEAVLENADATYLGPFDENCRNYGIRFGVLDLAERNFSHPELLRLFAILGAECSVPDHPGHAWFVDRYERTREEYTEKFRFDQGHGRISGSLDPERQAENLIALWDGLQLQWLIDPSRDMLAAMGNYFDSIGAHRAAI